MAPSRCVRLCLLLLPTASALSRSTSAALAAYHLDVQPGSLRAKIGSREPFIDEVLSTISQPNVSAAPVSRDRFSRSHNSNATQSEQIGVRRNSRGDARVLQSSLLFSGIASILLCAAFCVLRRYVPTVYTRVSGAASESEPAQEALAVERRGFLDWVGKVWNATGDEEVEAAGLDGWGLLEFYRFNFRVLSVIGPIILAALLPLHYRENKAMEEDDDLSRFDIGYLGEKAPASLWVHAVLVWLVVLGCGWYLVQLQRAFLVRRFAWLKTLPAPRATTIMIENIPEDYRSDKALRDYFVHHFAGAFKNENMIEDTYVVRKTEKLCDMVEELRRVDSKVTLAKVREKNGWVNSKPAMLENLEQRKAQLEALVADEQAKVQQGVREKDPTICSSAGFVTFSSEVVTRMAAREKYRYDTTQFIISAPPDPSDVNYEMLLEESASWESIGWLCLVGLFLSWSPGVVFISSLTTLSAISGYVPYVGTLCERHPQLATFLEGILATAALKLFLAFLPAILLAIISRFFRVHSGALAQLRLERWYFSFLVIFVLLVTTLGRSIVITVAQLVEHPTELLELLAESLPTASHFYFNYIIFGWLTVAFELLRFTNLLKYLWFRSVYSLDPPVAKAYCEPEDVASYGMGARMALGVIMSAIT